VEAVEKNALNRIGHAGRIIENETASLFIKAGNAMQPPVPGEFPIMILNPHPFDIDEIIEVELQLPEPNFDKTKRRIPFVYDEIGDSVPVQSEKPSCNIKEDHRKRVVFRAKIPAGEIRRYSCFLRDIPLEKTSVAALKELIFTTSKSKLIIERKTGFPKSWEYNSNQFFGKKPFRFAVIEDSADPWGMGIKFFGGNTEYFRLMNRNQTSEFAGLQGKKLGSVYISEYGEVRTVVESLFAYNNSRIHLRYFIPADLSSFDVEMTVYWMEKDKLLKWIIPVGYKMNCVCRSMSGINCFKYRNKELVFRDWIGMKAFYLEDMFSICSDGAYGFEIHRNNVGISLLRSPSYSGHPIEGKRHIVMTDRAVKRIDQGVHSFRFRFIPGKKDEIMDRSFNDSDLFNNPVICRVVYPTDKETKRYSGIIISNDTINLQAVKMHTEDSLAIRLLNPCKETKKFTVEIPVMDAKAEVEIKQRAIATFIIKKGSRQFAETDLLER
jgi:alpha-mannosidase